MTALQYINSEIEGIIKGRFKEAKTRNNFRKIFSFIDYTTLGTGDNHKSVSALVKKANQFPEKHNDLNVAAICVFPNFIRTVKTNLKNKDVKIASVSAAFPFSQSFREVKLLETKMAIDAGADEIDIVMPIGMLFGEQYNEIEDEIKEIKGICGNKHLKVILETAILKKAEIIKRACDISIKAGADFIKTSTGKNGSTASLDAFYIMCLEAKNFFLATGIKTGIKAAGGISTANEALKYFLIVEHVLGEDWLNKDLFRIGASSLIADLEKHV